MGPAPRTHPAPPPLPPAAGCVRNTSTLRLFLFLQHDNTHDAQLWHRTMLGERAALGLHAAVLARPRWRAPALHAPATSQPPMLIPVPPPLPPFLTDHVLIDCADWRDLAAEVLVLSQLMVQRDGLQAERVRWGFPVAAVFC